MTVCCGKDAFTCDCVVWGLLLIIVIIKVSTCYEMEFGECGH